MFCLSARVPGPAALLQVGLQIRPCTGPFSRGSEHFDDRKGAIWSPDVNILCWWDNLWCQWRPEQPALAWLELGPWIGHLQKSLSTTAMLWPCLKQLLRPVPGCPQVRTEPCLNFRDPAVRRWGPFFPITCWVLLSAFKSVVFMCGFGLLLCQINGRTPSLAIHRTRLC